MDYLIHHVFLPPKLPSSNDHSHAKEEMLMQITLDSLKSFRNLVADRYYQPISDAIGMLQNFLRVHEASEGRLAVSQHKLEGVMQSLEECGESQHISFTGRTKLNLST